MCTVGTSMKLTPMYSGSYKIIHVKSDNIYDVQKVGDCEGPNNTSASADHMKLWGQV